MHSRASLRMGEGDKRRTVLFMGPEGCVHGGFEMMHFDSLL